MPTVVGTTDATNCSAKATGGDFWVFFGVKTGRRGGGVRLRLTWGVGAVGNCVYIPYVLHETYKSC